MDIPAFSCQGSAKSQQTRSNLRGVQPIWIHWGFFFGNWWTSLKHVRKTYVYSLRGDSTLETIIWWRNLRFWCENLNKSCIFQAFQFHEKKHVTWKNHPRQVDEEAASWLQDFFISCSSIGTSTCKLVDLMTVCPVWPYGHDGNQKSHSQPPFGCTKPCKSCDKLPTSTGAGFFASIVWLQEFHVRFFGKRWMICKVRLVFVSIWKGFFDVHLWRFHRYLTSSAGKLGTKVSRRRKRRRQKSWPLHENRGFGGSWILVTERTTTLFLQNGRVVVLFF